MSAASEWPSSVKQALFLTRISELVLYANKLGYLVTLGRGYETPQGNKANGGKAKSLHLMKLAQDLCLFKDGVYLRGKEGYDILAAWWKSQGKDFTWGGDLESRDYNHYSLSHGGMR